MERITVDPEAPDRATLASAAVALRAGGLVAFPTETVYGLGAAAFDEKAVARVFAAKGRPSHDPLIIHVASGGDLSALFESITPTMQRLIDTYWPGPLTIVAPKHRKVPLSVTAGRDTVAVRIPAHPVATVLLELAGIPVAAPSANRFSYISPTSAEHVAADLSDSLDVLVDGGPTPIGIESTIVSVEGDVVSVLRRGAVVIDGAVAGDDRPTSMAPGRLPTHYAPVTPAFALPAGGMFEGDGDRGVVVGYDDSKAPGGWRRRSLGERGDLTSVARNLYRVLREVDASEPSVIVIEMTGLDGLGAAIDDRIRRAAGGRVRASS